jgi:DNA-binding MarR family transcriptional regulator
MDFISKLKKYILDTLGEAVTVEDVPVKELPYYLIGLYEYFLIKSPYGSFMLIHLTAEAPTPSVIKKHTEKLTQIFNKEIVYSADYIEPFNRKRLISYKVPFIVPYSQLYLPMLRMDMRERREKKPVSIEHLSPAAQLLFVYLFMNKMSESIAYVELAEVLKMSRMSVGRAIKEMEAAGIVNITKNGKERSYSFAGSREEVLNTALKYLRSPVIKEIWVEEVPDGLEVFKTGLDALSDFTMIEKNPYQEYAVLSKSYRESVLGRKDMIQAEPDLGIKLELWNYSPEFTASENTVDKLSLYLSLLSDKDERVQIANEELLKEILG